MENIYTREVMRLAVKLNVISIEDDFITKCVALSIKSGKLPVRLLAVTGYLINFLVELKNTGRGL